MMTTSQAGTSQGALLRALQREEASLTKQLAGAEAGLKGYEQQVSKGSPTSLELGQLDRRRESVDVLRTRLDVVRQRAWDVQFGATTPGRQLIGRVEDGPAIVTGVPATVGSTEPPLTIFGLTPTELRGPAEFILLLPLILALSRWIWRRSPARPNRDNALEGNAQINRLEQAVESIAIEVERIGEAQRFSAKLMAERKQEPVIERLRETVQPPRRVVTPIP